MYVYVCIYEQEKRNKVSKYPANLYSIYTWKIEFILLKIKLNNKNKLLHVCMNEKEEKKNLILRMYEKRSEKKWSILLN
jgi:hypothetical protein